jgi:uncharacterized protein (TIGR02996 family)
MANRIHPDQSAILMAIRADPENDIPRLVYADWLEEHEQPERAEFIRIECETQRTDRESDAYIELLRRSDRLRAANAKRWFGPLGDGDVRKVVEHIITKRGFVDCVVLASKKFTVHAELIFEYAPLLRGLHISDGDNWRRFFASPRMRAIQSLSFEDDLFTAEAARQLATHENALVELEIDGQPLGVDGMTALAAAPFSKLEKLSANSCGLEDDGAQELFANASLRNLRELDLSESDLSGTSCIALAEATGFGRLERLTLCDNAIGADGISALAAAPHLAKLKCLNLYGNPIGPAGGRAILASRIWGGLTEINLIGCGVGVEVVNDLRHVYGTRAVKA